MTVHMQESEAAENFPQFLAHLKAGDQVQLERGGEPTGVVSFQSRRSADHPGHIDFILRKLREFEEREGPIVVDAGYFEDMRKAHKDINQPWEPRTTWD